MSELDPDLREWTELTGPRKVLRALRERLVNGGRAERPLSLKRTPLTEDERREVVELFGERVVTTESVHLRRAQQRLMASRFTMTLEDLVTGVFGDLVTRSEAKLLRDNAARESVAQARADLLEVMRPVPQLADEHLLLSRLGPSTTNRVPAGTRTLAGAWSSYESGIRTAASWWPRHEQGLITPEKGLAASALGGAKTWTDAGRMAFQNLISLPFDKAVELVDTEIRLRGPLAWKLEDVVVDARTGSPWVSLPARGALKLGKLEGSPRGLLLIENDENFNQVCTNTDVHERWLCVWIKGFASHGLIEFIRRHDWTLAAWCDLDPSGIEIIANVMNETGREVHPVGMEPELWRAARKRRDSDEKREEWRQRAVHLSRTGPPRLRALATAIATTGARVEQEELAVYDRVIPTLAARLETVTE